MMNKDETWLLREKYDGVESEGFHADRERLMNGEPLAYIIGFVPFLDCRIYLDSHPLIPRTETEYWTEKVIEELELRAAAHPHVLDMCAGSGCIGVAIANALPTVTVDFAELDARHLPTIRKNLQENLPTADRHNVFQSDLFANVSAQYDLIVSNPPYIDPKLDRVAPSVKAHEPAHALYGGTNGMEFLEHIIAAAQQFLRPHGSLWLEHEPEQVDAISALAEEQGYKLATHTDQFNTPRFSVLTVSE